MVRHAKYVAWMLLALTLCAGPVLSGPAPGRVFRLHSLVDAGTVFPGERFLATHETAPVLAGAWGEREATQLLLVAPEKGWRGLEISFDAFRHLDVDDDVSDFGLVAELADGPRDPLRPWRKPVDLDGGAALPVWLQLRIPEDARPGRHRAMIHLAAEGWRDSLALDVEVWPFELIGLPPLEILEQGRAPSLDEHWLHESTSSSVRANDLPAGDLPGLGPLAPAYAARRLPSAVWRGGLTTLILGGPPAESRNARRLADGFEDLDYLVLLSEEESTLAETLLKSFPIRGLVDGEADAEALMHWHLAAGACLAGEEDFARQWIRQMEARPEHGGRAGRVLIDPGEPARNWRGGRRREALDGRPGLAVTLDEGEPQVQIQPLVGDWREEGHLEMEIRLAEGPPARVDLFLERRGFRRQRWSWRLHLRAGETRQVRVPLPFGRFDLGRVSAMGLRLADDGPPRRVEIREPRLR